MKQEIKTQWVNALRSGDYKQAHGVLGYKFDDGTVANCCLGVLCDLAVQSGVIERPEMEDDDDFGTLYYDHNAEVLPEPVIEWAELGDQYNPMVRIDDSQLNISLAELNDGESYADHQHTFNEIADVIEEQL